MDKLGIKTKVVLFLGVGIILMALLIILFTKTTTLFHPSYEIKMRTEQVGELSPGHGVFLNGIKIGDVVGIELEPDLKHAIVRMKILGQYKIGKDARFAIHQQGFLGQYYVEVISTGTSREYLKDGDLVQSEKTINFIEAGKLSYGLITRFKEALSRVEGALNKSRNLFNSNTYNEVDLIAANFGKALVTGTSIVSTVELLIKTNSPIINKISSDFTSSIKNDYIALTSSFNIFTNQILTLTEKIDPYLDNIGSNFSTIRHQVSQFKSEKETDKGDQKSPSSSRATNFTEKISRLLRATEQMNEFTKNLNALGLVGALKQETVKKQVKENE